MSGLSDPLYGYCPAANAIVNRLKDSLLGECVPQKLHQDADGAVQCLVLVTLPKVGAVCDSGLAVPEAGVLARFRAAQEAAWKPESGLQDPEQPTVCKLNQLIPSTPGAFGPDGTCSGSTVAGWCYVEGQEQCPQQLIFSQREPPPASTVNLLCIEQARNPLDGGN